MPLSAHVRRAVCLRSDLVVPVVALAAGPLRRRRRTRQKERTFYTAEEFARATGGRVRIEHRVDPAQEAALRRAYVPLPVTEFTVIAASEASTWIRDRGGRHSPRARATAAREYFAGRRWLPDDHVTGIGLDGDATWIETPRGYSRIAYVPMTLAEKSGSSSSACRRATTAGASPPTRACGSPATSRPTR